MNSTPTPQNEGASQPEDHKATDQVFADMAAETERKQNEARDALFADPAFTEIVLQDAHAAPTDSQFVNMIEHPGVNGAPNTYEIYGPKPKESSQRHILVTEQKPILYEKQDSDTVSSWRKRMRAWVFGPRAHKFPPRETDNHIEQLESMRGNVS